MTRALRQASEPLSRRCSSLRRESVQREPHAQKRRGRPQVLVDSWRGTRGGKTEMEKTGAGSAGAGHRTERRRSAQRRVRAARTPTGVTGTDGARIARAETPHAAGGGTRGAARGRTGRRAVERRKAQVIAAGTRAARAGAVDEQRRRRGQDCAMHLAANATDRRAVAGGRAPGAAVGGAERMGA